MCLLCTGWPLLDSSQFLQKFKIILLYYYYLTINFTIMYLQWLLDIFCSTLNFAQMFQSILNMCRNVTCTHTKFHPIVCKRFRDISNSPFLVSSTLTPCIFNKKAKNRRFLFLRSFLCKILTLNYNICDAVAAFELPCSYR